MLPALEAKSKGTQLEMTSNPFHQPGLERLSEFRADSASESRGTLATIASMFSYDRDSLVVMKGPSRKRAETNTTIPGIAETTEHETSKEVSTGDSACTDMDMESHLHTANHAVHWLLFGGGKHKAICIVFQLCLWSVAINFFLRCQWTEGKGAHCAIHNLLDNNLKVMCLCLVIEQFANLAFGYTFLKNKGFTQILSISSQIEDPERRASLTKKWSHWLLKVLILSMFTAFLNVSVQTLRLSRWDETEVDDDNFGSRDRHIYFFINFTQWSYFTLNYYCCGMWVWIVMVHHDFWKEELESLLTVDNISKRGEETNSRIFNFLQLIDSHSQVWMVNHVVRAFVGIIVCLGNVSMMYFDIQNELDGDADLPVVFQHASFVFTYYTSVWATFLVAGYANDDMQRRAKTLLGGVMFTSTDKSVKDNARNTMQSMEAMNTGYRVAGLVMHLEKAISVGSIAMYAMVSIVKLHHM